MKDHMIKRLFVVLLGLILAGVGIGLFLYSGMGVDPASVFQTGVSGVLHIGYGTASALSNIVILAIVFFLDKRYIHIASLLAVFAVGYSADFTSILMHLLFTGQMPILAKLVLLLIGTTITALGVAVYIQGGLGVGAIDMISEVISDKCKLTYKYVRMTADILFVIVGYLMGGVIGMGTVVSALLTGPIIAFFRPFVKKWIDCFLGK